MSFVGDIARDALAKLRAAEQERDAALDREALARDELAEVHRVADSFLADEREERAMAETYLGDQLEQARGIAVALEQQNAAGLALHAPTSMLVDCPDDCTSAECETGAINGHRVVACSHCTPIYDDEPGGYYVYPCPTARALDPVAAELADEPDGAAS